MRLNMNQPMQQCVSDDRFIWLIPIFFTVNLFCGRLIHRNTHPKVLEYLESNQIFYYIAVFSILFMFTRCFVKSIIGAFCFLIIVKCLLVPADESSLGILPPETKPHTITLQDRIASLLSQWTQMENRTEK